MPRPKKKPEKKAPRKSKPPLSGHPTRTYTTGDMINALSKCRGLISVAAKALGCTAQTIRLRMKTEPEIKDAIRECREALVDLAEQKLVNRIKSEDTKAILFTLATVGRKRGYGKESRVKLSNDPRNPLNPAPEQGYPIDKLKLPLEVRKQLRDAIRRLKEEESSGVKV